MALTLNSAEPKSAVLIAAEISNLLDVILIEYVPYILWKI